MKKLLLAFYLYIALFSLSAKTSFAQSCIQDCVAAGNGMSECSQICSGGTFIPPDPAFDPLSGPTQETFDSLNPLRLSGSNALADDLSTPGGIVTRLLYYSFPIAGLILFIMLVWGGFEILLGSASKKLVDAGKQRITAALVGFGLLFSSYWIMQIIEEVFGIRVL